MRAVLDANVIISATLSPEGSPARVLLLWVEGWYELVCSPLLLDELERALRRPKLQPHIQPDQVTELLDLLRERSLMVDDSEVPPDVLSADPDDNYLIALASRSRSVLVSGDRDLLRLSDQIPVYPPAEFLRILEKPDHTT